MGNASHVVPFGTTPQGQPVSLIKLNNEALSCEIITYGAAVRTLIVPDRNGALTDVVLGYDTLDEYVQRDGYLGATVGRFANRIAKGRFSLNGKEYILSKNDGENHLHGGLVGFSHRVWDIVDAQSDSVTLSLCVADGEEGYPGNLDVRVSYTLNAHSLSIHYWAISDQDTPCSLTNHSYFNLAGHQSGTVFDQKIAVFADRYVPSDRGNIPLGTLDPVAHTPMNLRRTVQIGTQIDAPFRQLTQAQGYDHNYVLDGAPGILRPAAHAECGESGIVMDVKTTMPGLQFYTANCLPEGTVGKGGCCYGPHHGFCLETQHFPDAVNHPEFPSAILKAGSEYWQETRLEFSTLR